MTEQAQIIRWEEPPSKRSGGRGFGPSRYTTVAAELRANRGRWAVIYEGPSGTGLVTAVPARFPAGHRAEISKRRTGKSACSAPCTPATSETGRRAMPETWIDHAIARFDQPHIAIAEPVIRPGLHRRCWAWNVEGHNYHVSIDLDGEWYTVRAGAPYRQGSFSTETEPTDTQIRELLTYCWPGFAGLKHPRGIEHTVQLSSAQTQALRLWLARPNGSHRSNSRACFEAVGNGGLLVRTEPYTYTPTRAARDA